MKVAIVGCGQIADAHIQEVQKIPNTTIVGVCDLSQHLAWQAAVRYQIAGFYTDIERMLKEAKPDVVHITTPPSSHWPLAEIVLKYGSHIYMEKPFTVDLQEAHQIVDLAVQKGKLVCAGHNSVFDPAYQRLLAAYREKKLGDIVHMVAVMGYNLGGPFGLVSIGDPLHWLHQLPGGLAQNNMSHPISMLLGLMPGETITVSAKGRRLRNKQYNDCRDIFFDEVRANVCVGSTSADLIFSTHLRPVQNNITVFGSQCSAVASLDTRTLRYIKGSTLPGPFAKVQGSFFDAKEAGREFWRNVRDTAKARLHYFAGMRELFIRFYAAIEGSGEMPIPMSEALRVTSVMDNIIRECKKNDKYEGAQ